MIKCPHCGETWSTEDLENIGDIGCPSCRRCFDVEDLTDAIMEQYIDEDYFDKFRPPMDKYYRMKGLIS